MHRRPYYPADVAGLADERDEIRCSNPADPRIRELNLDFSSKVDEYKRNKWLDLLK